MMDPAPVKRGPGRPRKEPVTIEQYRQELRDVTSGVSDMIRGEEKREPTATERMEALRELRRTQGVIVARPAGLTERMASYAGETDDLRKQQTESAVVMWLTEVANLGSGQDVDAAWYSFHFKSLKDRLFNEWERLRMQAERAHYKLASAAEVEAAAARREWQRKQDILKLNKDIAALEVQIAAKKQLLARLTAQ